MHEKYLFLYRNAVFSSKVNNKKKIENVSKYCYIISKKNINFNYARHKNKIFMKIFK